MPGLPGDPEEDLPLGFPELRRGGGEDRPPPLAPPSAPTAQVLPEALQRNRERRKLEEQLDQEAMRVNRPLGRVGGWLAVTLAGALLVDFASSILLFTPAGWVGPLQRLAYAVEWVSGVGLVGVFVAAMVFGYVQNRRRQDRLGE